MDKRGPIQEEQQSDNIGPVLVIIFLIMELQNINQKRACFSALGGQESLGPAREESEWRMND